MESPKKIYPTAAELSKVVTTLYCTEEGCSNVFSSESNLTLHLVKTHKKTYLMTSDNTKKEYHCPELSCIYNSSMFFKNVKLLKQHYLKVHGEKSFICDGCNKGFPTQAAKRSHSDYCGVIFKCCECDTSYPCYESLKTHSRRKKHTIREKLDYKIKNANSSIALEACKSETCINSKKEVLLLPKTSTSLHTVVMPVRLISVFSEMFDKGSQTEINAPKLKTKRTQITKDRTGKYNSQQTQTFGNKKPQTCAETQTVGDYLSKKSINFECNSEENLLRKSIKTQTKPVKSQTKSCNTSFNINDLNFTMEVDVERNSSSTQTPAIPTELIYSTSTTTTHDSIHTDTSDLNFEFMNSTSKASLSDNLSSFDSSSFFNCNSETQTDIFGDELFNYCDYYNNMCTQTCEDILLDSFGFNNIHTQTALDDMLRSVESQTMMSNKKNLFTCRDMAHIETQTDNEFKQMLEEINA